MLAATNKKPRPSGSLGRCSRKRGTYVRYNQQPRCARYRCIRRHRSKCCHQTERDGYQDLRRGQAGGLDAIVGKAGNKALPLDLTVPQSIRDCVAAIEAESGGVTILVNCAGYGLYGSIEEIPLDDARRQFEVNLFGLSALTQLVLPGMRSRRKGKIINISSIGGVAASPYGGWYHATKFALEGYSASLRQELSPSAWTL